MFIRLPSARLLAPLSMLATLGLVMPDLLAAVPSIEIAHARDEGYPYVPHASVKPGEYFALQCAPGCTLRKTGVTVSRADVETTEGPAQGMVVRSPGFAPSLFLVRGLAHLQEGPVTSWYANARFQRAPGVEATGGLRPPQRRSIDIDGKALVIEGEVAQVTEPACAARARCGLIPQVTWKYRFGGVERTLAVLGGETWLDEPIPIDDFLVWVGDIDADGKPDLVVRPQASGGHLKLALFLSTQLAPGKPWRPAATFYFWDPAQHGC